jgi:hypothetical protein
MELVVARYREDLNWLRRVPPAIGLTVYNKSEQAATNVTDTDHAQAGLTSLLADSQRKRLPASSVAVSLPNVGREAHTYLHHLVTHYDDLPDYIIFCQGKPFDHAFDFHASLRTFATDPAQIGPFRWLGHIIDTDDAQGQTLFRDWSKNEDGRPLDMRGFHRQLFDNEGPAQYTFVLGAQFAVSRAVILSRPLAFYQRALSISETFPDAAHCFERSWDRVFGLTGIDPDWLAGRTTVYLKPVRKLAEGNVR